MIFKHLDYLSKELTLHYHHYHYHSHSSIISGLLSIFSLSL